MERSEEESHRLEICNLVRKSMDLSPYDEDMFTDEEDCETFECNKQCLNLDIYL